MEPNAPPSESAEPRKRTPWGAIIGIILILAVIVGSAYYSFHKRYQPAQGTTVSGAR